MSDLTKWPRLIVVGENVSREQASDILIRSTEWRYISINDRVWERYVEQRAAEFLGRPVGLEWRYDLTGDAEKAAQTVRHRDHREALEAWCERYGILDLHYLNNERIMSSWIGGPKGWCDWDGRIGCSTYNIGKWPSTEEVTEDLAAIAAAWPFLTMHVQLVADEGDGELLETWAVCDGKAALVEPIGLIAESGDLTEMQILGRVLLPGGERGVTPERLREALQQVAGQRGGDVR